MLCVLACRFQGLLGIQLVGLILSPSSCHLARSFSHIQTNPSIITCVRAKSLQSSPILCDPTDCSPPGSSVHGILQAKCWSELPFPSPGDLPDPGIERRSLALQADSLPSEPPGKPLELDIELFNVQLALDLGCYLFYYMEIICISTGQKKLQVHK